MLSRNRIRGENYINGKMSLKLRLILFWAFVCAFGMCKSDRLQARGSDWQQLRIASSGGEISELEEDMCANWPFLDHKRDFAMSHRNFV